MAGKYKNRKLKSCFLYLPIDLYEDFHEKIISEGWTIQQALHLLVWNYTVGNFDLEKDKDNLNGNM